MAFHAACLAAGFPASADHNAPFASGVGAIPLNTVDGLRWSTQVGYLNPAAGAQNLTILPDTTAVGVVLDGPRATGVRVCQGRTLFVVVGREIVLSAGAVGSPHLLMLSGIGPADQLQQAGVVARVDLPGIGQNLRDHPHVYSTWAPGPNCEMDPARPRYQVALRYTSPGSPLRNDLQILIVSFATARVDRGGDGLTPVGLTLQPVLNLAAGRGKLHSPPRIQRRNCGSTSAIWRNRSTASGCGTRSASVSSLRRIDAFQPLLGQRIAPAEDVLASDAVLDAWMAREVTTTNHISGTCKMGPYADQLAVIDQYGRVRGVDGLRVVDASIMPDCIRANTNATAMMIGERLSRPGHAQVARDDWHGGIITGAGSGIGAAAAIEFARLGARLTLASLATPGLAQTVSAVARAGGALLGSRWTCAIPGGSPARRWRARAPRPAGLRAGQRGCRRPGAGRRGRASRVAAAHRDQPAGGHVLRALRAAAHAAPSGPATCC